MGRKLRTSKKSGISISNADVPNGIVIGAAIEEAVSTTVAIDAVSTTVAIDAVSTTVAIDEVSTVAIDSGNSINTGHDDSAGSSPIKRKICEARETEEKLGNIIYFYTTIYK
jgi:hypothetical protein